MAARNWTRIRRWPHQHGCRFVGREASRNLLAARAFEYLNDAETLLLRLHENLLELFEPHPCGLGPFLSHCLQEDGWEVSSEDAPRESEFLDVQVALVLCVGCRLSGCRKKRSKSCIQRPESNSNSAPTPPLPWEVRGAFSSDRSPVSALSEYSSPSLSEIVTMVVRRSSRSPWDRSPQ